MLVSKTEKSAGVELNMAIMESLMTLNVTLSAVLINTSFVEVEATIVFMTWLCIKDNHAAQKFLKIAQILEVLTLEIPADKHVNKISIRWIALDNAEHNLEP